MIQKGNEVRITENCMTPFLRGYVGKVVRVPRNNHYIIKFIGIGELYIFGEKEVEKIQETQNGKEKDSSNMP